MTVSYLLLYRQTYSYQYGRTPKRSSHPARYLQPIASRYISPTNYSHAIVVAHYRYQRRLLGYRLGYIASCIHLHLASSCARTYVHHLPECVCLLIWVGLGCRLNYIGNGSNWSAYSDYTNDVFADAAVDYDYHDGDDDDGWELVVGMIFDLDIIAWIVVIKEETPPSISLLLLAGCWYGRITLYSYFTVLLLWTLFI